MEESYKIHIHVRLPRDIKQQSRRVFSIRISNSWADLYRVANKTLNLQIFSFISGWFSKEQNFVLGHPKFVDQISIESTWKSKWKMSDEYMGG